MNIFPIVSGATGDFAGFNGYSSRNSGSDGTTGKLLLVYTGFIFTLLSKYSLLMTKDLNNPFSLLLFIQHNSQSTWYTI